MEQDAAAQTKEPKSKQEAETLAKPKLQVVATRGSITDAKAPVVVIGGYKGIAPAGALKSLDDALQHWITRAGEHGMIGGDLGELFFVPVMHKEIAGRSVLLAGMGEYGKFNYNDLCYLALNICYAASALKLNSFATVLIGSGEGNLEIEEAVRGLLSDAVMLSITSIRKNVSPSSIWWNTTRIAMRRLLRSSKM